MHSVPSSLKVASRFFHWSQIQICVKMATVSESPVHFNVERFNPSWQCVMLRVKDPSVSVPFYEKHFGLTCVHSYVVDKLGFSLFFLEKLRAGQTVPEKDTLASEKYLWNMKGTAIELFHNHGSEKDDNFSVNNGNVEPYRGFGHIAFNTSNVFEAAEELEANGVKFQKRPSEGRMKNIAFALDPDGYWIELVGRNPDTHFKEKYNFSQTMIRIKDPKKSIPFYTNYFGMTVIKEAHMNDFSLYFLANLPKGTHVADPKSLEATTFVKDMWYPVLELTHNHGTENDENFHYHNGNDAPQGFGNFGFVCDDVEDFCKELESRGVPFSQKFNEGEIPRLAFAEDPDGYSIEIIPRSFTFSGA
ncbi:putative glyoxalase I [Cardiosporidium cionae]|uniref:lactoylglutathione lyase n=1 Tax=Cardiosporidium cionae TaxID=476202 RepID=A0ABQ7J7H0_9APIC|nr:putative glyoxalase I [Cardiosporidium cionae]|eukprot:KAF8819938.1 putative glyoxalase I [Cardiosporidium cionae]